MSSDAEQPTAASQADPPPDPAARVQDVSAPYAPEELPGPVPASGPSAGGSIAAKLPIGSDVAQQKPEILVAGAFVGAFLLGRILKHITSE